jgi:Na+-driven multidrug efflux pump
MNSPINKLIDTLSSRRVECEVDEELRFHLEMLASESVRRGSSSATAQAIAQNRFGEVETIRRQCLAIARRRRPVIHALRLSLTCMFAAGFLLRIFGSAPQFDRLADLTMAVAVFAQLFLYVRSLLPTRSAGHAPRQMTQGK